MTMKSSLILMLAIFTLHAFVAAEEPTKTPVNEHVKFSITLKERSLKTGGAGNLLIRLQPKKGIHINLKPAISIAYDSTGIIARTDTPMIPATDTFLNTSKPIQQHIMLASGLKPGKAVIKGVVTYFYCSDAEGWCSRFKQSFELPVRVVK
jgi:hypothetical protein